MVLIGEHCPPDLPVDVRAEHRKDVRALMSEVSGACSADIWTKLALAAAACPHETFGLTAMANHVADDGLKADIQRQLRRGLMSEAWDETRPIQRLLQGAPSESVLVATIEISRVRDHDVVGLILHAIGRSVPIDWARVRRDSASYDGDLVLAVCGLLNRLRLLHESQPGRQPPPLVTFEHGLGEHAHLRAAISALVDEYVMAVSRFYGTDGRLIPDLFALRRPGAGVSSFFGAWPLDSPPAPSQMRRWGASRVEFMAPYVRDGQREYSVAGPPLVTPHGLPTLKSQERASELTELIAATTRASFARALRLDDFRHTNTAVFRRQALLMSLLYLWWTSPGSPRPIGRRFT